MTNALVILTGIAMLMLQGFVAQVTGTEKLAPSFVLPVVLYMSVGEFSLARGVSLAFVLGYFTDAFAGFSMGVWTFTLVSVFLLARAAGLKLFLHGVVFQILLTFVASFFVGVEMTALLMVFDRRPLAVVSALSVVAVQSIPTALFAPLVFALVRSLPGVATLKPEEA